MATKLDKALRRELDIGDKVYTLVIDPQGLKLTEKGRRIGEELSWTQIIGGNTARAATAPPASKT